MKNGHSVGTVWAQGELSRGQETPNFQSGIPKMVAQTPPRKLTQKLIYTVEPTDRKQRFRDQMVSGLELRITPGGTKSFAVRYRKPDGRQGEFAIGRADAMTLPQARRRAREVLVGLANGLEPNEQREQVRSKAKVRRASGLDKLAQRWTSSPRYAVLKKSTRQHYENMLRVYILPEFGDVPVKEITRSEVARLLDEVAQKASGSVSNAVRGTLSALMSFAMERDLIDFNPVSSVRRRHKPRVRNRVLSDAELRQLWHQIEAVRAGELVNGGMTREVATALKLFLLMPLRGSELMELEWEEVSLEQSLLTLRADRMKNHKAHEMPIGGLASETLNEIAKTNLLSEWVFPNKSGLGPMPARVAGRACRRFAGTFSLPSFGPHDIRRTIATRLAGLGFHYEIIERLLGHSVGGGRAIVNYDHFDYRERKLEALQAWERELLKICCSQRSF